MPHLVPTLSLFHLRGQSSGPHAGMERWSSGWVSLAPRPRYLWPWTRCSPLQSNATANTPRWAGKKENSGKPWTTVNTTKPVAPLQRVFWRWEHKCSCLYLWHTETSKLFFLDHSLWKFILIHIFHLKLKKWKEFTINSFNSIIHISIDKTLSWWHIDFKRLHNIIVQYMMSKTQPIFQRFKAFIVCECFVLNLALSQHNKIDSSSLIR